ncbi:hypothetical protein K3495_g5111 [Podosphaera aphanis]|nr:hypothetical protein K3495_g5111 [Podosphaera aphanis]
MTRTYYTTSSEDENSIADFATQSPCEYAQTDLFPQKLDTQDLHKKLLLRQLCGTSKARTNSNVQSHLTHSGYNQQHIFTETSSSHENTLLSNADADADADADDLYATQMIMSAPISEKQRGQGNSVRKLTYLPPTCTSESTPKRSSPTGKCSSKKPQFIPDQYFRIPSDQLAILRTPSSWFEQTSGPNIHAQIPQKIEKEFVSFLSQDVSNLQQKKAPPQNDSQEKSISLNFFLQENHPTRALKHIPSLYYSIPHDQLTLLEDPKSWYPSKPDSTSPCANIPPKIREGLTLRSCPSACYGPGVRSSYTIADENETIKRPSSIKQYHGFNELDQQCPSEQSVLSKDQVEREESIQNELGKICMSIYEGKKYSLEDSDSSCMSWSQSSVADSKRGVSVPATPANSYKSPDKPCLRENFTHTQKENKSETLKNTYQHESSSPENNPRTPPGFTPSEVQTIDRNFLPSSPTKSNLDTQGPTAYTVEEEVESQNTNLCVNRIELVPADFGKEAPNLNIDREELASTVDDNEETNNLNQDSSKLEPAAHDEEPQNRNPKVVSEDEETTHLKVASPKVAPIDQEKIAQIKTWSDFLKKRMGSGALLTRFSAVEIARSQAAISKNVF